MEENVLITLENSKNYTTKGTTEAIHLNREIKEALEKKYEKEFRLYTYSFGPGFITYALSEDIKENKVEYVATVLENISVHSVRYSKEKQATFKKETDNAVYYYPEFEVVVAEYKEQSERSINYEVKLYATNDENVKRYVEYIMKKAQSRKTDYVTTFTDYGNGLREGSEKITKTVSRDEVFLEEELKEEIYRSIDSFFSKEKDFFKTFELPYKRGILLYGPPGNGKTTLVKSIVNTVDAPVAYWQVTEATSSATIKQVFERAAEMSPMILIIEDIDSIPERVRSTFLNTLDGATSEEGIFLIATTNYPERIDPALINRAGRFDQTYEITLPNEDIRYHYLKSTKIKEILTDDEQLKEAAKKTDEFSIAQLGEFYKMVALQWYYDQETDVDKVIQKMKDANQKQQKGTWQKSTLKSVLGFTVEREKEA